MFNCKTLNFKPDAMSCRYDVLLNLSIKIRILNKHLKVLQNYI